MLILVQDCIFVWVLAMKLSVMLFAQSWVLDFYMLSETLIRNWSVLAVIGIWVLFVDDQFANFLRI